MEIKPIEQVTISKKRYLELLESEKILNDLCAWGVDNWEGYREAFGQLFEEEEDD